jgi:rod shape-determining protein MreC
MRLEQAELLEDARQGQRLQALLGFQQHYIYKTLPAEVYGASGSIGSHVFYIDKGSDDGLKPDLAVITPDGIVGKVRDVFPHSAQVLAVNDQTSGAGVILAATRVRGILRGDAAGHLEVVNILADERIKPGEKVLTAGGDLIFPRGLPVGEVEKVVPDPDRDGFIEVILKPAAHLDQLDEVLVITSMDSRFPEQEKKDMATSETVDGAQAAMEAQRKAAAISAERLPSLIEPNVPPAQQPINDSTPPVPAPQPPQPLHPDLFSPAGAGMGQSGPPAGSAPSRPARPAQPTARPATRPAAVSPAGTAKSGAQAAQRRQP